MIVGIGVDLVDIPRFERQLARTPRLLERLFAPAERPLAPRSLAARYAAKEALIKALGGSDGVHWTEIEIVSDAAGKPSFSLTGSTATVIADRGIAAVHLSMSHDAGLAVAYVVADAPGSADGPMSADAAGAGAAVIVDASVTTDASVATDASVTTDASVATDASVTRELKS